MMMSSVSRSKIAWITGASSGIGRALALKLVGEGFRVAASARNADALAALASEAGDSILAYPLDITDRDAVKATAARIEADLGPIQWAVFSAGNYLRERPTAFDSEKLRQMVELNIVGTGHCLEAVIPSMVARGEGRIGLIASVSGYTGLPGGGIYGGSKSMLITLAEAMHPELAEKGVTLSIINPGFVKTPLTDKNDFPMPFLITAEEAADHIVHGMSKRRFEIAFPWQMVLILKLLRRLPYGLYFAITRKMLRKDR
ncbi:SDR family NAD(P)-dependent oxidoreductase [Rhizobium paknamense]|uniref:Short-subunit dehydrogenase n=1 Tax=Rhizobium paknamense TaxID=1206817 RepID=A0ABU0IBA5_9HYPH|nr:SDR family NAD(P)-dependent oxidoreductase [Rhizobium paknamense]MDQ0455503.1 short-subunit dehydrogenase [Rhizobium paknamense]